MKFRPIVESLADAIALEAVGLEEEFTRPTGDVVNYRNDRDEILFAVAAQCLYELGRREQARFRNWKEG